MVLTLNLNVCLMPQIWKLLCGDCVLISQSSFSTASRLWTPEAHIWFIKTGPEKGQMIFSCFDHFSKVQDSCWLQRKKKKSKLGSWLIEDMIFKSNIWEWWNEILISYQAIFFFLACSLTGFLALDLRDFKELYCPIKQIMIEEIIKTLQMARKGICYGSFLSTKVS